MNTTLPDFPILIDDEPGFTLGELLANNDFSAEETAMLAAMVPGQRLVFGGGAAAIFTVERPVRLALPWPAWHRGNSKEQRDAVRARLRTAKARQIVDMLDEQSAFLGSLSTQKAIWQGNAIFGWQYDHGSQGRYLSRDERDEIQRDAEYVEGLIKDRAVDLLRESVWAASRAARKAAESRRRTAWEKKLKLAA